MMVELQRISSHLVWLGTHAIDLGAMSVFLYCFREREEILKIFEMFAGQRMMTSYIRIGGVALQPPAGWRQAIDKFLKYMPSRVDEYETLLTENRIWMGRTKNVGYISAEDAIALSMTGPTIRAAGMAYDNRKLFPYSSYEEFDFDVPTRTDSDCFGALHDSRGGNAREPEDRAAGDGQNYRRGRDQDRRTGNRAAAARKNEDGDGSADLPLQDFHRGIFAAAGEAFVTVESPRGELGCFIASDGSPKPLRVHFRSPSYINLQALPKLVEGQLISDVIACIGTHRYRAGRGGPLDETANVRTT